MLKENSKIKALMEDTHGRVGYLVAWLLGVPASVLLVIFLLRGH